MNILNVQENPLNNKSNLPLRSDGMVFNGIIKQESKSQIYRVLHPPVLAF